MLVLLGCSPREPESPVASATPPSDVPLPERAREISVDESTVRFDFTLASDVPPPPSFFVLPPDLRPRDDASKGAPPAAPDVFLPARFEQGKAIVALRLGPQDRVFGLGDKTRGFNRRGSSYELWNTDAFGYGSDTDPLYKSIPFLLVIDEKRAFGVYFDSTTRARLDVGKTKPDVLSIEFEETESVSAYVFSGEPADILRAYTRLTGRTPLPPLWALGFHMSKYGYMSEAEVRNVVKGLRKGRHPADAIWLDIDFQEGNAPFTVNQQTFPAFDDMIADFTAEGVHTVVITDPHIKSYQGKDSTAGYLPYESGVAGDHFIREGDAYFEGPVWPGPSVFPEFTLSRTRTWWGTLYEDFARRGVAGFWNDMNEPALLDEDDKTMPTTLQHRMDDGGALSHTRVHNAYGSLNAQSTYEGLLRIRPTERPFILTRAAAAGVQRHAASWTGDNTATFEHLALSIHQINNLGVSGFPFVGADVGGFIGCPSPELLAAWMELGAYQPFYRNHSQKESCAREPWVHGKATEDRIRRALERRYQLLPYIYTLFEQSSRDGSPVNRPLWFEYPTDAGSLDESDTFLLGSDLLVATRLREDAQEFALTVPPGSWIDRTTGLSYEGPKRVTVPAGGQSRVREFARAGAILPEGPVVQHVGALNGELTLHVYPGPDCRGRIYADDGKTFAYRSPDARLEMKLSCSTSVAGVTVRAETAGKHEPWWKRTRVVVHFPPAVGEQPKPSVSYVEAGTSSFTITVPPQSVATSR